MSGLGMFDFRYLSLMKNALCDSGSGVFNATCLQLSVGERLIVKYSNTLKFFVVSKKIILCSLLYCNLNLFFLFYFIFFQSSFGL